MTIKNYLKNLKTESNVKGLWYEDFSKDLDILSQFEEFKNVQIEFIKDIRKEPINSTIILKNLTRELFKTNIRLYSIWLDKQDVYFHISKNSLKK
jgi:L-rhamnose mutarotase